ncbi:MAG: hypothetical protein ACLUNV_05455 [Sutterella wadsworthensis]
MLNWLIGTLFMAFPLLPIFTPRSPQNRLPLVAQRLFMRVALAFYAISRTHRRACRWYRTRTSGILQRLLRRGFWMPPCSTTLGLACQILAIVALMFVVNWKVIRLYYGEDRKGSRRLHDDEGGGREGRQCRRCST